MVTFKMDGKSYRTDQETLDVLRSIVPSAERTEDTTAVAAVMYLGLNTGRIEETS